MAHITHTPGATSVWRLAATWTRANLYEISHRRITWVLACCGLGIALLDAYVVMLIFRAGDPSPVLETGFLTRLAAADGAANGYALFLGALVISTTAGRYGKGVASLRATVLPRRGVDVTATAVALALVSTVWSTVYAVLVRLLCLAPAVSPADGPGASLVEQWICSVLTVLVLTLLALGTGYACRAVGRGMALWYVMILIVHSLAVLLGTAAGSSLLACLDPFMAAIYVGTTPLGDVSAQVLTLSPAGYWATAVAWTAALCGAGAYRALREDL